MSDEKQKPQLKRQQQQPAEERAQQHHQQYKSLPKDVVPQSATIASATRKSNINELRNSEYVSRLMAATPPYLYSAPVGPNNFFFSDMLRSLVQARNTENVRNLQLQQSIISKRSRKRSWSQHRPYLDQIRECRELDACKMQQTALSVGGNMNAEKPLELTNKSAYLDISANPQKMEVQQLKCDTDMNFPIIPFASATDGEATKPVAPTTALDSDAQIAHDGGSVTMESAQDTPTAGTLPAQQGLVLPPTAPIWYPPHLYPPYGIDPLHFFIDLRVSGHIYDRKKENLSPLASMDGNSNNPATSNEAEQISPADISNTNGPSQQQPHKYRQGSAFSVPVPRLNSELKSSGNASNAAINLTSKFENYARYYDFGESKENQPTLPVATGLAAAAAAKSNASYMLQQLPRLYSQFAIAAANQTCNSDNKSEPDCDADSDEGITVATEQRERDDIDVELIDSIKYHRGLDVDGGESSCCTSPDDASITQID